MNLLGNDRINSELVSYRDSGHLFKHILDQRTQICMTLTPLCDFLRMVTLTWAAPTGVHLLSFWSHSAHTTRNSRRQTSWTQDVTNTVFTEYNIELKTAFYSGGYGSNSSGKIVTGLVPSAERHKMLVIADLENPEIITDHPETSPNQSSPC
jgi:hypothetical protein